MLLTRLLNIQDGKIIEIRRAKPDDAQGIIDCFNDVMSEGIYLLGERYLGDIDFLEMRINDEMNELFLVAIYNKKVVGVLTLTRESFKKNNHVAFLGIAIIKDFRHRGIGKAMMETSFEWAKQMGIEKICLEVFSTNTNAIELYKKMGFEIEGIRKKQFKIEGEYVDDVLMAKFL
ncbi:MAG: GNAT family N-acetyltransferase [Euryarchaeota archaeon]|jgi:ribosomal protein S18 acetylase RimI-like enzyme|nr:GNAT family N-acetyltransferase [Euryarchaeota archaeon]MVT35925.1 GNAT family N-acetyltransferase [Euryarchaeota archaeon]